MNFYSLNNKSKKVSFKEATILGQAPDKGLYYPESIPKHDKEFIDNIENYSNEEIAFKVMQPYVKDDIDDETLFTIVSETINFPIPLVPITNNISSLELFHGPTLAFKDVGARFMSRCLSHFSKDKEVLILVATSGDTGAAVANGFYNIEGVKVLILFPSGKVSSVQEKQLTTLGNNIHALEVEGSFDDCQSLVKQAFSDKEVQEKIFITSANSINVARWLPQQIYYFLAWKQWQDKNNPPVVCVPSGNFGNICAGLLAQQSGVPFQHFIAACNANNTIPEFFKTKNYQPKKTVPTISNAMDVSNPSNFVRVEEMYNNNLEMLQKALSSYSITDDETIETIKKVYQEKNYLLDPHAAVGYFALENYLQQNPNQKGFLLETAHPVKFYDVIEPALHFKIPLPKAIESVIDKKSISTKIKAEYSAIKNAIFSI